MDWMSSSSNYSESYFGNFSTSGGAITGGTVTQFIIYDRDIIVLNVTGLNLSASTVFNAIRSSTGTPVADLIMGGNDTISGSQWADPISGGPGADTVIAYDGADTVAGGAGDDDINGNVGEDIVAGEAGADTVRGGKDNDTISGGAGNDPHVNGNIGDDVVMGDDGDDTVYGGQDQDWVQGGAGDDMVSGDLGADTVDGGRGEDILVGGTGADRFVFHTGDGVDGILDFSSAQGDRIVLPVGTTYTVMTLQAWFSPDAAPAGWGGYAVVDIHNDTDAIILVGVTPSQMSDWLVFA
jgi:Ca2+-binding RTX toxin-like protein